MPSKLPEQLQVADAVHVPLPLQVVLGLQTSHYNNNVSNKNNKSINSIIQLEQSVPE